MITPLGQRKHSAIGGGGGWGGGGARIGVGSPTIDLQKYKTFIKCQNKRGQIRHGKEDRGWNLGEK